jgi:hypothetical protein
MVGDVVVTQTIDELDVRRAEMLTRSITTTDYAHPVVRIHGVAMRSSNNFVNFECR